MIFGLGTDIVAVARMEALWQRYGERTLGHLLTDFERQRVPQQHVARFLAKRFAAKEAFGKAAGTGLRAPVSLQQISVANDVLGKPQLVFAAPLQHWLDAQGVGRCHVSLSDERSMVVAVVILENAI